MSERILDCAEIREHPELADYRFDAPEGTWTGRLDARAWGQSSNLLLYFTDVATGQKYRLSTFHRQDYQPYSAGPSFRDESIGQHYTLITAKSRNGLPKLMQADRVSAS